MIKMSNKIFEKIFYKNYIPCSSLTKFLLIPRFLIKSLIDPKNAHDVAILDDLLSKFTLPYMKHRMENDFEGYEILKNKPLLNSDGVDFEGLGRLPNNTLGFNYYQFMNKYKLHMDSREPTHFIDDQNLSYILMRNRQLHDITHVAYGLNINLESEIAIKVIELLQTGLPMPLLAVIGGLLRLPLIRILTNNNSSICNHDSWKYITSPLERVTAESIDGNSINYDGNDTFTMDNDGKKIQYPLKFSLNTILPWAIQAGLKQHKPMYMVNVENWLDKPLVDFKEYMGVIELDSSMYEYVSIKNDIL